MVAPLAPHIAEELWARLGHADTLAYEPFPSADEAWLVEDTVEVPVQVNGKVRARIDRSRRGRRGRARGRGPRRRAHRRAADRRDRAQGHRRPRPHRQLRPLTVGASSPAGIGCTALLPCASPRCCRAPGGCPVGESHPLARTSARAVAADRRVGARAACVRRGRGRSRVVCVAARRRRRRSPASERPRARVDRARATSTTHHAARRLVVDVVGAVRAAGVVRMPAGARVVDAIAAAGGATADADLVRLNLAAPVGRRRARSRCRGGRATAVDPAADRRTSDDAASGPPRPGPVNVNTATRRPARRAARRRAGDGRGDRARPRRARAVPQRRRSRSRARHRRREARAAARSRDGVTWSRGPLARRLAALVGGHPRRRARRSCDRDGAARRRGRRARVGAAFVTSGRARVAIVARRARCGGLRRDDESTRRTGAVRRFTSRVAHHDAVTVSGVLVDDPSGTQFAVDALVRCAADASHVARGGDGRRRDAPPRARSRRPRRPRGAARCTDSRRAGPLAARGRAARRRRRCSRCGRRAVCRRGPTRCATPILRGTAPAAADHACAASPGSCSATPAQFPTEVTAHYRDSGLSHLLAVSGENVAFVLALAGPAAAAASALGARTALALAVVVLFATHDALRAVGACALSAMAAIALLATLAGRPASRVRVLAYAVIALLLVDPFLLALRWVRLSCGASAGIALRGADARAPAARAPASYASRWRSRSPRSSACSRYCWPCSARSRLSRRSRTSSPRPRPKCSASTASSRARSRRHAPPLGPLAARPTALLVAWVDRGRARRRGRSVPARPAGTCAAAAVVAATLAVSVCARRASAPIGSLRGVPVAPFPTLRLGSPRVRRPDPRARHGHPQPHARFVLRPRRDLGVRRVPAPGRGARARRRRPARRRRREGRARARGRRGRRSSTGSCPRSRRCARASTCRSSVDTWRASVLDAACAAGAVVGNDISGFARSRLSRSRGQARRDRRRDPHPAAPPRARSRTRTTTTSSPTSPTSCSIGPAAPRPPASHRSRSCSTPGSTSARRRAERRAAPGIARARDPRLSAAALGVEQAVHRRAARPRDRRPAAGVAGRGRVRRDVRLPHRARARRAGHGRTSAATDRGRCCDDRILVRGADPALRDREVQRVVDELLGGDDRSFALDDHTIPSRRRRRRRAASRRRRTGGRRSVSSCPRSRRSPTALQSPPFMTAAASWSSCARSATSPPSRASGSPNGSPIRSTACISCSSRAAAAPRRRSTRRAKAHAEVVGPGRGEDGRRPATRAQGRTSEARAERGEPGRRTPRRRRGPRPRARRAVALDLRRRRDARPRRRRAVSRRARHRGPLRPHERDRPRRSRRRARGAAPPA